MRRGLTFGVVGHVDHGKTALVRALTGIETDRLAEERARGLSIVLGFAFLETPHGTADLIDVPGHERFIRAMIAGASALDAVLLCVAANEGIKPQTVEHLQIARLLGVESGVVVITKADLADAEQLEQIRGHVRELTRCTFLEQAPVVEVSAATGAGLAAVQDAITALAAVPAEPRAAGRCFMPLDRVFTMRGFGVVVTGTLRGGELALGDPVEIVPGGTPATVRGLENHNRPIVRAAPGQRVAVNLRQLRRDDVRRGDVLAAPGTIVPARHFDAELRLLPDAPSPIRSGAVVRFLTGATDATARVRLLDGRELTPGERGLARLELDRDIATRQLECFLLRSDAPRHTMGGGRILDIGGARRRRFDRKVIVRLEAAVSGDVELAVRGRVAEAGGGGVRVKALAAEVASTPAALRPFLIGAGARFVGEDFAVDGRVLDALAAEAVDVLDRFHRKHPLRTGLDAASLAGALRPKPAPEAVQLVLADLLGQRRVERRGELYCVAGFDPVARLGARQQQLCREIEQAFLASGLEPPAPAELVAGDLAKQALFKLLVETGTLVMLRTYDRRSRAVLHARVVERAIGTIAARYPYPEPFAVKDVRDLLGSTRRRVVPLLEHLDAIGATVRTGDQRRLRTR